MEREFEDLYNIYLENFDEKRGNPVCYDEFVNNELEELRKGYRRYLKEAVLEDENFDEDSVEDFREFCEEELKENKWIE